LAYLTRCLVFPSFFLAECGFDKAVGFCVAVGLQCTLKIEDLVVHRYRERIGTPTDVDFRDGCRTYSLFTCFVRYLVEFLEAVPLGKPRAEKSRNAFIKLMACLPVRNEKLLRFTLGLVWRMAGELAGKNNELSDRMMEALAVVLGANYRKIFNDRQQASAYDEKWALHRPNNIFQQANKNVTPDDVASPAELIATLESVIHMKQGMVDIGKLVADVDFSGKVTLSEDFINYINAWTAPILCRL
jgi:hypothetical protein